MTRRLSIILAAGVLASCLAFAVRMTVLEARARREAQEAPPTDATEWMKAWLNGPVDYEGPLPSVDELPVQGQTLAEAAPAPVRPLYEVRLTTEEGNAMMAFANAFHAGRSEETERHLPAVRAAMSDHAVVLATLRRVAERPLEPPGAPRTAAVGLDDDGIFATGRLAEVSAMVAHLEGRDDEALAYLRDVSRLAVLLATEGGIGEVSVANWALLCTSPTAAPILAEGGATSAQLREHIETQRELRRRMAGDALSAVFEGHLQDFDDAPYLTEEQAEWVRRCFRDLADEARKPRAFRDFGGRQYDAYLAAGDVRDTRLITLVPDGQSVADDWDVIAARLLGEEVLAALELCRRERGAYPGALADLVPGYLDETPLDPFTEAPLRYSSADGTVLLYSVGPDGNDDGGVREYRASEYPDLVFAGGVVQNEPTAGGL